MEVLIDVNRNGVDLVDCSASQPYFVLLIVEIIQYESRFDILIDFILTSRITLEPPDVSKLESSTIPRLSSTTSRNQ